MTPEDFRAWRKRMEFTQVQAAEAMGVSRDTIIRIEAEDAGEVPKTHELATQAIEQGNHVESSEAKDGEKTD